MISKTLIGSHAPTHDANTRIIASFVSRLVKGVFHTLLMWQQRYAQRKQLQGLDDRMLKDIGLTRADVAHEISKPMWLD
ncbi:MAG: DUF1127 domain-containing protein [Gammaproteobacteria bacterium]